MPEKRMSRRHRDIVQALALLGGQATVRQIADKLGLNVNGVSQSVGVIGSITYDVNSGKGGKMICRFKNPGEGKTVLAEEARTIISSGNNMVDTMFNTLAGHGTPELYKWAADNVVRIYGRADASVRSSILTAIDRRLSLCDETSAGERRKEVFTKLRQQLSSS